LNIQASPKRSNLFILHSAKRAERAKTAESWHNSGTLTTNCLGDALRAAVPPRNAGLLALLTLVLWFILHFIDAAVPMAALAAVARIGDGLWGATSKCRVLFAAKWRQKLVTGLNPPNLHGAADHQDYAP